MTQKLEGAVVVVVVVGLLHREATFWLHLFRDAMLFVCGLFSTRIYTFMDSLQKYMYSLKARLAA